MINISEYLSDSTGIWIALITLLVIFLIALFFDLTYESKELTVTNFKSFFAELEELSRPIIEANQYYNTFGNFRVLTESDYKEIESRFLGDIEAAKKYKPTYKTEPKKPSATFKAYQSYVRDNRPTQKVEADKTKLIPLTESEKIEFKNNCIELEKRLT